MEQLDDDLLYCVLIGWRWIEVRSGEAILEPRNLRIAMHQSLVSQRWCRIMRKWLSRMDNFIDVDRHTKMTDAACGMLCNITTLCLARFPHENTQVTNAGLACMTRLRYLAIGCHPLIDHVALLPTLTCLETLCLSVGCLVDDTLVSRMTWLKRLELQDSVSVGDAGVAALTQLAELSLEGNNTITSAGVAVLTRLTTLDISFNTHIDLKFMLSLPSLCRLTAMGVGSLSETLIALTQLQYLKIDYTTQIDPSVLLHLSLLEELEMEIVPDDDLVNHTAIESLRARGVLVTVVEIENVNVEEPPLPPVVAPELQCVVQ